MAGNKKEGNTVFFVDSRRILDWAMQVCEFDHCKGAKLSVGQF